MYLPRFINPSVLRRRDLFKYERKNEFDGKVFLTTKQIREARYNKMYNALRRLSSKGVVEKFQDATSLSIIEDQANEKQMVEFFDLFNLLSFGGFDYYHVTPIGEIIDENDSIVGMKSTATVFINRDHLDKLRQTVECIPSLGFISYKDDQDRTQYSIWNIGTNNRIDLVPFKRYQKGIEVVEDNALESDDPTVLYVYEGTHDEIPFKSLSIIGNEYSKEEKIYVKKLEK